MRQGAGSRFEASDSVLFLESIKLIKQGVKRENILLASAILGSAHLHASSLGWTISHQPTYTVLPAQEHTHTQKPNTVQLFLWASFQIFFPRGFDHAFRSVWQKHQQTLEEVAGFLFSFSLFQFLQRREASCSLPLLHAEPICQHSYFDTVQYLRSVHPVTLISSLLFLFFFFIGSKTKSVTAHQTDIYHLSSSLYCRCNSLGADDIWDQTIRWDSSQWNSWDTGEGRTPASATNLHHRCLHDHGEM